MSRILLLLLVMLAFVGTASATDYYVATWGDNTTQGNITHPWQNVSYATQQAVAGDTIYLFNGTWYGEHAVFANSGNATYPIIITAYNGTPTMDGVDKTGDGISIGENDHISISHLTIRRYYTTIGDPGSYMHVSDCELYNTSGVVIGLATQNSSYNIIENCTLHDAGWNTIQVVGQQPAEPENYTSHHLYVLNNTFYNNYGHTGTVDVIGNTEDLYYQENNVYDNNYPFHVHYPYYSQYGLTRLYVSNNTFTNISGSFQVQLTKDSVVTNNIVNKSGNYGFQTVNENAVNLTLSNNIVRNQHDSGYRLSANNIDGIGRGNMSLVNNTCETGTTYEIVGNHTHAIIKYNKWTKKFKVYTYYNGSDTVDFPDGRVFSITKTYGYEPIILTYPKWYPSESNFSVEDISGSGASYEVTDYNVTLRPTYAYLCNVTVNHESNTTDDRTNITVNSTITTNPTWINATMRNTSNTYNVSVDGVYITQTTSDADGIVHYQYSSSWSPHIFEFDWLSDVGFSGAPDPTNLANTTGVTWVNHTWQAGSGNVTDSYNVSINSIWHNSTTNTYYNDTGLSAESWSNITVWAFNNTGGISQNGISQNIQSNAAAWAPSNAAMYYNVSSTIEITTKTDGTNLFNRTPTEMDGNVTSCRLVVKTS